MIFQYCMAFLTLILSMTVTMLFWKYLEYHFKYWERRRIPHIPPIIPTGNMSEWMRPKHFTQIFAETYEKYRDRGLLYAGFFFNMQKAAIILDLNLAKLILVDNFSSFDRRGLFYNEKGDPLTGNLFLMDGPKWQSLRGKLTPTFAPGKMKYMFPTILKVGDALKMFFEETAAESKDGIFDINYLMDRFTVDVIGNCAFGVECNSLKDPSTEFYVVARKFFSKSRHIDVLDNLINCFPEWAKRLRMKIIPQDVTDYYMKLVKNTVQHRELHGIKKSDYLDLLIELKNQPGTEGEENLTSKELAAQTFAFFVTAFDTCSSTMSYALYELANNPDVQKKLRLEIQQTLKQHKQKLTYDCLKEMKYLDQVISETLRKYPATPALFRICSQTYTPPSRPHFLIEKNCLVIIPTMSYHYDAKYFPSPFTFDPDRFSSENIGNIKSCSYLPYGEGKRKCIGLQFARMQIRIGLVKLIKNFKFEICSETQKVIKICIPSFNLNPTGITLKVTKI